MKYSSKIYDLMDMIVVELIYLLLSVALFEIFYGVYGSMERSIES